MKNKRAQQLLQTSLLRLMQEQNDRYADDTGSDMIFSPEFEHKMQKLIYRQNRLLYPVFNTVGKRVASVLIVLSVALIATAFSVKAIADPLLDFIEKTYQTFSTLFFSTENKPASSVVMTERWVADWIPDGLTLTREEHNDSHSVIIYQNASGKMLYMEQFWNEDAQTNIDTENVQTKPVQVGEYPGITYQNKDYTNVLWSQDGYSFILSGTFDLDQLIRVGESVHVQDTAILSSAPR